MLTLCEMTAFCWLAEIEIIIREVTDKNAADESARYTTYTHTRYNLRIASNYGFIYLYSIFYPTNVVQSLR